MTVIIIIAVVLALGVITSATVSVRRRSGVSIGSDASDALHDHGSVRPSPGVGLTADARTSTALVDEPVVEAEPTHADDRVVDTEADAIGTPPKLRDRLGKTRAGIAASLGRFRGAPKVDDRSFDELEEALLVADVGLPTTTRLLDGLRAQLAAGAIGANAEDLLGELERQIVNLFDGEDRSLHFAERTPTVWLFVGVNGVGKTTTIGKVASHEIAEGHKVVLAAADTFRAAAAEQLETWAQRSGASIIRGAEGADPSSVVFDAVSHGAARGADLVLADSAGRLHTKVNLMEELKKIHRVADRPPGEVAEVLLVLDATTGQNGLVQAREFAEAVSLTGVVLTKLDGSAKGGIVLAIRSELGLPIKLVGIGEQIADLVPFNPEEFAAALLT